MPRIRKSSGKKSNTGYWIVAVVAAALIGVLIGYEQWGMTAAVVSVVEKEMAMTQAHIKRLEKRVGEMELRLRGSRAGISASRIEEAAAEEHAAVSPGTAVKQGSWRTEGNQ